MAQTGYTPISIYYSATATNTPTAGNLVAGELAINTADGKLFYKDSAGVVQTIASKATGSVAGSTTQVIYNNAGSYAGSANMTFDSTKLTLANDASISGLTVGKGYGALDYNTAFGITALGSSSLTGNYNTAVGYLAGSSTTSGAQNTFTGRIAGSANTTGSFNAAFGDACLNSNTTGSNNTSVGQGALTANTTASYNTAVGYQAGYTGTTAQLGTFVGYQAGYNATGNNNTFVGPQSGKQVTSGASNTIIGGYTGYAAGGLDIRTSSNYIVLSDGDGNPRYYFDAASGDWILNQLNAGYYCLMRYKNQTGAYFSVGTQSGSSPNFQIYNPSGGGVYLGYSASSWTGVSDERLKNITAEISDGLNKVNQLRAVEFTWKRDETNESQVGLIAQDVQAVLPQAIGENDGYLGVRYTEVIPLLVAAIKELNAKVTALENK